MNGKKARAIRKASKLSGKLDLANPDYRISKETKKMIYTTELVDGLMVNKAKTITMQSIVNLNRIQYRNYKKVFKGMPRNTRSVVKEK